MGAVAMGLIWAGYGITFWGWTLVKGYNISVSEIFIPGRYKGSWPPPALSGNQTAATTSPAAAAAIAGQDTFGGGVVTNATISGQDVFGKKPTAGTPLVGPSAPKTNKGQLLP